jgi:hypothetical protein
MRLNILKLVAGFFAFMLSILPFAHQPLSQSTQYSDVSNRCSRGGAKESRPVVRSL